MNVALSSSITQTAVDMASQKNSDALNIRMLNKALAAADMIQSMRQSMPQPALATSGSLGTKINTFA